MAISQVLTAQSNELVDNFDILRKHLFHFIFSFYQFGNSGQSQEIITARCFAEHMAKCLSMMGI